MQSWFKFTAKDDSGPVELSIYDVIGLGCISAQDFIAALKQYEGRGVKLGINSPGGEVTEGVAIFNALSRHPGGVEVQIDGIAASMASYIAMVGRPVKMSENSYLMIHDPSGGAYGKADDVRKVADLLDSMKNMLVTRYAAKAAGKSTMEDIESAMEATTYYTAQQAFDAGLIDEITDRVEITNVFDLSNFRNAPSGYASNQKQKNDMKNIAIALSLPDTASEKDITDKLATIQGDASTSKTALATAQGVITAKDGEITALKGERDDLSGKLTTANASITTKDGEITALKSSATNVTNEANRILASFGHRPLEIKNGANSDTTVAEMSRAEFSKLTPSAKCSFFKGGGRLVD